VSTEQKRRKKKSRTYLVNSRLWYRVEVTANHRRDLTPIRISRRLIVPLSQIQPTRQLSKVVRDLVQLVHEHRDLHQFDVPELGVPVDVGVGDDQAGSGGAVLEEGDDGDVVLGHDAVEHVLRLLEVRTAEGDLVELDEVLFDEGEAGGRMRN
jgi:hypothetical protein